jgi:hypothetical protein
VSEVGGSDRIGLFSSGYDREYATAGVRSDTDLLNYLTLEASHSYSAILKKGDTTNDVTPAVKNGRQLGRNEGR